MAFLNIGVQEKLLPREKKLVRLTNGTSITVALITSPYIFQYLDVGAISVAIAQIPLILLLSFAIYLNSLYRYRAAKYTLLLSANFFVFLNTSTLGFYSGENLAIFSVVLLTFVLFDLSHKRDLILFLLVNLAVLITLELTKYSLFLTPNAPQAGVSASYLSNFISTYLFSILIAYYFQSLSNQQENDILRAAKKDLETIYNNSYDALFLLSKDNYIIQDCNKRALQLFGADSKATLINHSLSDIFLHKEQGTILTSELVEKPHGSKEEQLSDLNGQIFWGDIAWKQVIISNQETIVLRVTDVSHKKEAEKALIGAKMKAEETARVKSEFIATMSHEIRTPMNAVVGMTSLLRETSLDEEQRDYAETIRQSSENLIEILNNIFDYSNLELGNISLSEQEFMPNELINELFASQTEKAEAKNLEFSYYSDTSLPNKILGDSTRLRQVLLNLIDNAIKFTHQGEVSVKLEAGQKRTDGKAELIFSIADTGIGIPENLQSRLFQSFTQLDGSHSRKYGGTGLGLALSQEILNLMGSEIKVESEVGKGSCFSFSIIVSIVSEQNSFSSPPQKPLIQKEIIICSSSEIRKANLEKQYTNISAKVSSVSDLSSLNPFAPIQPLIIVDVPNNTSLQEQFLQDLSPLVNQFTRNILILSPNSRLSSLTDSYGSEQVIPKSTNNEAVEAHLIKQANKLSEISGMVDTDNSDDNIIPKLLVVEDNLVNQKVVLRMLKKLGYEADVADNGKIGLEAAIDHDYDLILMDIQMPEMDGLESTRRIRQQQLCKQPIIIALTANATTNDRAKCFEAGMDDFMAKPVKKSQMEATLNKWKHKSRLKATA